MWSALPEIQRYIVTLRYSPSDNTAATVAVTTGGGATNLQKYSFWFAIHGRSNTLHVITATVAAVGESGSINTWAVAECQNALLSFW
jgi:hypothetical protein